MHETTNQICWIDLLTDFKYRPAELFKLIDRNPTLLAQIEESFALATRDLHDWPLQLRDWRVVLAALIQVEIGTIADPYIRALSNRELLAKAKEGGISPAPLKMVGAVIDEVYDRLIKTCVAIPRELIA